MSSNRNLRTGALMAGWLWVGFGAVAYACGPYFPNRILTEGDLGVLAAPVADFAYEIERIPVPGKAEFNAIPSNDEESDTQTPAADLADLHAALEATANLTPERRKAAEDAYVAARQR